MGASYSQFCPVAKAMELLDERWTLLVVRELVVGSEHFNELRRGLPRMSPTLLSRRLQQLVRAGVITREETDGEVRYRLTEAGEELRPVVEALGTWGTRWIPDLADPDLDPKLLLWDMHRNVDHGRVPARRTVLAFEFDDVEVDLARWWLVISSGDVDVCDDDPGDEPVASVQTSLRTLTEVWRGDKAWSAARGDGSVRVVASREVAAALPGWFLLSPFAGVPRPLTRLAP
ncbi:HxlR family transcriptional regulator [Nocardioides sp. Root122]|uniref:winged helix-turn-helix transcriptional regulator n=1 Tax=Nocardioides TaxID=1839 RepID=UPI000702CBCE|nr:MULTISPECIES: helix-turn-helix domain-containing protein [Nocardioides]KQV67549.1 HxlR family transcriptional regulator [Nocardioides sp. Root122]MCK9824942.1 helix-turn-helix transcriptional regulator [Nocardioides cavernae]